MTIQLHEWLLGEREREREVRVAQGWPEWRCLFMILMVAVGDWEGPVLMVAVVFTSRWQ